MAQASLRPPSTLQPRPKAVPTFSSNTIGAVSRSSTPQLSRPASRSRNASPARSAIYTDVSDRATTALVRRVLCPNAHGVSEKERPIHELLPPLTSSNEVDLQLYAIIAVVVKDLVYSWYGKITPDQTFVEEVVKIIAHCTRALESRLRNVDVHALILDEIPELVERHLHAYRTSRDASLVPGQSTDSRAIYHSLNLHPALSPVPDPNVPTTIEQQARNESEYRQLLVQGALAVLLPTEDLENACLRTLVTDVISEVILANSIGGTLCEGWFVWGSVVQLVEVVQATLKPRTNDEETKTKTRGRLEKFGLLSGKEEETAGEGEKSRSRLSSVFWRILQYCYLASIGIRFIIVELFAAHSQPRRSSRVGRPSTSASSSPMASDFAPDDFLRPLLDFRMLPLAATLIDLPRRLPWISGLVALIHHHLTRGALRAIGGTDGILDHYLHCLLTTYLSPATLLPQLLRLTRQRLFPQNTLPPPPSAAPPPPSRAQAQQMKRKCAQAITAAMGPMVCKRLFGGGGADDGEEGEWVRQLEGELDAWADGWMTRHLAYRALELVVVRVLPEMGERGVKELMEMRVGGTPD